MENLMNKELYIQRRTQQLQQWERVLNKLISRVDKTKDQNNTELFHQVFLLLINKNSGKKSKGCGYSQTPSGRRKW